VTRVIFVVFSERDEKMYRKGITFYFPPADDPQIRSDGAAKDRKQGTDGGDDKEGADEKAAR
jgi:hypothetical protein